MSPRFWTLLGLDPTDQPHKASAWQELIHSDDLSIALDNFARHCEDPNHPYDQVVGYKHRDGSTVWVRCRGIAIRDSSGKPVRMLGAHTDITARKEAEERLQEANRQLTDALAQIKTLTGLVPICSHCKSIRDDQGFWTKLERYLADHADVTLSHGICPSCVEIHYGELFEGED